MPQPPSGLSGSNATDGSASRAPWREAISGPSSLDGDRRGAAASWHDAVGALEMGWDLEEDESLLVPCNSEQRALLTNNVADFTVIARRWAVEGRRHAGLIFTSDTALPRSRATIGKYVQLLDDLLRSNQRDEAFVDRVHWLTTYALSESERRIFSSMD